MATTFFLGNLDYELLVIRDSEFLQSEHRALRLLAVYHRHIVLGAERFEYLLLHGSPLDNLLIHNLEADIVNIKGDITCVLQFGVKVEKPIVCIDGFQKELHSKTL